MTKNQIIFLSLFSFRALQSASTYSSLRSIVFSLFFMLSVNLHASFPQAMAIYNAGDYERALAAFEALAAIGNRSALFNLGVMNYRGEGTEKNLSKAYAFMSLANDGFDDENFTKVINAIRGKMPERTLRDANQLREVLSMEYAPQAIVDRIFPKPLNDEDCPTDYVPIMVTEPEFPKSEMMRGRMGQTELEITISPEGYARDISVNLSTSEAYSKASVKAAKGLRYSPPKNGEPVNGVVYLYTYKLSRSSALTPSPVRSTKLLEELKVIQIEAEKGSAVAQFKYATGLKSLRYFKEYLKKVDLQYKTANEWFLESANSGLPQAQFQLGQSMLNGRGCEIDRDSGFKWINASAVAGYSPAQRLLARSALSASSVSREKARAGIDWLRNAVLAGDSISKLLLAWEIATSPYEGFRDGQEALQLLASTPENYFDEVRIFETKAAAYAETGEFHRAITFQQKALKKAKKNGWVIPSMSERLELYQHKNPYRGGYYGN